MLSVFLMIADNRPSPIRRYRQKLDVVVFPVRWVVDAPFRFGRWVEGVASVQSHLVNQNADLKVRNLLLQSRLQKMLVLEKENKQLSTLLQGSSTLDAKIKLTRILAIQTNPEIQQCVLSTGTKDGVYVGQPVLDSEGLMGQVTRVNKNFSTVLLITDSTHAIPVQVLRTGMRSTAEGISDFKTMTLRFISPTSDVKVGDQLVSSGLGGRFPAGYPVGIVTAINHKSGANFVSVEVTPSAHINKSKHLLLVFDATKKRS